MKKIQKVLVLTVLCMMTVMAVSPVSVLAKTGKTVSWKQKQPVLISVENDRSSSIIVKWKKIKGADGYKIQISKKPDFSDAVTRKVKGNKRAVRFKKLDAREKYYVRVKAYRKEKGKTVYTKWSSSGSVKISFHSPSIRSATPGKRAVKLKWSRVRGADGYEIEYAVNKDFSDKQTLTFPADQVSARINDLERNQTYWFRIQAFKKADGSIRHSGWKRVKVQLKHTHIWKTVREAWDEEILVQDAWTESVLVEEAWDEEIYGWVEYCNGCGQKIETDYVYHECDNWGHTHADWEVIEIIHHDAVYEEVYHPAEYRTVHHPAEKVCKLCGETK